MEEFFVIYDVRGVPRGRTVTMQEADALCDKKPQYQWDIKKHKKYQDLPIMTISDPDDE